MVGWLHPIPTWRCSFLGTATEDVSGRDDKRAAMDDLEVLEAEVKSCPRCRLCETRKEAVPGEGARRAAIMFIGEAPGYWENEEGRPFVGPAGRALREMLDEAGIDPRRVRLAKAIPFRPIAYSKDRKPRNRSPTIEEVDRCGAAMLKEAMSHLIPGATPQPKRGLSGAAETPLCNLKVCFCNFYVSL